MKFSTAIWNLPVPKACVIFSLLAAIVQMLGCASPKQPDLPHFFVDQRYVDVEPGWRIKVVTPIIKGGEYKVQTEEVKTSTGSVEMRTSADFIGYEVDYYAVESADDRIAIRFLSAETRTNGGNAKRRTAPLVPLFTLPADTRNIRLLFLTRVSPSEHNAAVLSANSSEALNKLTNLVEESPAQNCGNQADATCSWIPEGISVQAEKKTGKDWVPAL